jgi:hypothetical protein
MLVLMCDANAARNVAVCTVGMKLLRAAAAAVLLQMVIHTVTHTFTLEL